MKTQPEALQALLATLNIAADASSSSLALATRPAPGSQLPAQLPAASQPVVTVSPPAPPILKGRPRTGAVAQLPKAERDMVCRMISNHVPYNRIVGALEQVGFELTERNISNWVTHGGYAEWCALDDEALQTSLRQDDLLHHHRNENSPDLAEVGLQAAAVRLSELLLRHAAANQDVEANFSKLEPVVNLLCRINKELFTAQKYRDDCLTKIFQTPARTKAKDREHLTLCEAVYSAEPKPKLPAAPGPGPNGSPTTPPPANAQPQPATIAHPPGAEMPAPAPAASAPPAVQNASPAASAGLPTSETPGMRPVAASSTEIAAAPSADTKA